MTDRDLFIAALGHSDPAERAAWLDRACAGDPERRRRVEVLLRAHDDASRFLAAPSDATAAASDPAPAAATDVHPLLEPSDRPGLLGTLDHYEVIEVVGRGGMGVVLKAFDPKLHRLVALKLMAPHLAAHGAARKRFEREAKAVASVRNEHVVAIHGVEMDDPTAYLVMEFVGGVSLQDRIDCRGPAEVKEVLRIGMQAARGLAAAHAQGLVHRDVKPANILLENGVERVKITDFGLARAADDVNLTQSGVITGTPNYMSPEQASGAPIDARSDLFSLGAVLFALCTGHPPFRADTPLAVLHRVCNDPVRPPREVNPDVPDWLDAIVRKLLAKNPIDRFQSATEVADLLGRHLAHLQQPNTVPFPPPVTIAEPPSSGPTPSEPLSALEAVGPKPASPRPAQLRWPVTFGLLALLGLLLKTQEAYWQGYFRPGYNAPVSMLVTSAFLLAVLWWCRRRTDPGWYRRSVELAIAAVVLGTVGGLLAAWGAEGHLNRLSRASTYHTLGLMASALIVTGAPVARWAAGGRAPRLARATAGLAFVAVWSGVALAYWAVAVGRWVLEPSEPRDPSGYIQIVCDDPNLVVTANGPGETLVLNNPGHSSVVGERLQAGARYRLTIARGADVLHTETVLLAAGERREVHIPPIILAEHTVAMKPSASSFPSDVVRMQISPDRSAVAVARLDGQILVFDAATGRERFTVSRPRTHCLAFGFTPDSSRLAYLTPAGGDEQVLRVVASADGHAVEPDLKPGGSWLVMNARTLAFSPDGARLTISTTTNAGPDNHWESRVFRFELTRGDRRWRDLGFLDGPPGMIEELRFTGDGSEVLAVSGTGEAVGWRWDSGQASRRYASGHYASIDLVAAGRNHEAVAGWSSEFKKASIDPWLPGAPKEPSAAPTSAVAFGSLAFSPDDQLLAAGTKGVSNVQWDQLAAVRVWAARSWKDRAILLGHTDWVLAIAFEPAGAGLVTAGMDGTVRTWRLP